MITRRDVLKVGGSLVVVCALPGCSRDSSGSGYAMLGDRLHIHANGKVDLYMGKVELGQGIGTAIAQITADELGVDMSSMQLKSVDTMHSPDESYTFSSISIQQSGGAFRHAAAAGRRHLLGDAARRLATDVDRLSVKDGAILERGQTTGLDIWQLIDGEEIVIEPADTESYLPQDQYRYVGMSMPRIDIPGKVFGDESFLQDLRLDGMVHARIVRPPAERATLDSLDASIAKTMPGVLDVVLDGNFIAVIATREQQARNAASALRRAARWTLPGDLPDADRLYEWLRAAPSRVEKIVEPGAASSAGGSTTSVSAEYQRPYHAHASISPSMAVALYEDGDLTVWSHGQGMYPLRAALAHVFGLDQKNVRCIHREASGCYGHNGKDDAACDAAAIAIAFPGRPVRLQWERDDEFAWEPYGSAMHIEMRAELDDGGSVRSWTHELWSCPHTSRPRRADVAGSLIHAQHRANPLDIPEAQSISRPHGGADRNSVPIYRFDQVTVTKHLVTEMPLRVSALRGLGAYADVFAIESFVDELASRTDQDPIDFRLKYLEDERAIELLERLADIGNWTNRPAASGGEGWGLGFARFKNMAAYAGILARIEVEDDKIRMLSATAVCDAGLVVNPDGVRAQIEGGVIQSASWTLMEQVRFSTMHIESRDWSSYPIMRFDQVPDVDVHLIDRKGRKSLGVGEAAQGPTAAAIANAVYHATGQRLRQLPLTPGRSV